MLVADIIKSLSKFDHWSIQHINKEANLVAHVLAKKGFKDT